jgi:regulator of replication initiation timing
MKGVCRKDVKSHVSDKLLDKVVTHGAQMKSFEAQLKGIKESLEQRVTELEANVNELRMENRKLDLQNKELEKELKSKQAAVSLSDPSISKQPPATFVTGTYKPKGAKFTMTDFEEYRMDGDEWYSPHFCTHPNGYKMCLCVFPNGDGPGKGTHLSLSLYLMRGEFDDQLKWPFRGNITIKLVDQEKNKDHVVETIYFDAHASRKVCEQVTNKDRSSIGRGISKLIPLAELRQKHLKNNCIKLFVQRVELL